LLAPRPTPKLEDNSLLVVGDCLFNVRSYPSYRRPFLHPQPEDAPCRSNRDPLITWNRSTTDHIFCIRQIPEKKNIYIQWRSASSIHRLHEIL